jgi:hypothetical protein
MNKNFPLSIRFALTAASAIFLLTITLFAQESSGRSPAGVYYLSGVGEHGSRLILQEDGKYRYSLSYGAYDEYSYGTWKAVEDLVILNSEGEPVSPEFNIIRKEKKPGSDINVLVKYKNKGIPGIDIYLETGKEKKYMGYTQKNGLRFIVPEVALASAIGLGIRIYKLEPIWTDIDLEKYNDLIFEFNPGTLGMVVFQNQIFYWKRDTLTTSREGKNMIYRLKKKERN